MSACCLLSQPHPLRHPSASAQGPELPPQRLTQRRRHRQADRDGQGGLSRPGSSQVVVTAGPEDHQAQPQLSHSLARPESKGGGRWRQPEEGFKS